MSQRTDFFAFRRYVLELEGVSQGAFEELVPPATQLVDEDVTTEPPRFRRRPLRLLRGVANTRELLGWLAAAVDHQRDRTAVVLELDDAGEPVRRHTFAAAWPVSVELATLSTEETHSDVDALTLATRSWTVTPVEQPPAAGAGDE